jgi:predicted secreted protein
MATVATKAYGAALTYNSELVGEIVSISLTRNRAIIPIHSTDTTNNTIEKIAGSLDEGEMTATCYYDGSATGVYNDLNTDFLAGTANAFSLAISDTTTFAGSGIISALSSAEFGGPDDPNMVTLTIAISGQITYLDLV